MQSTEAQLSVLARERSALEEQLQSTRKTQEQMQSVINDRTQKLWNVLAKLCEESASCVRDTLEQFDNPAHLSVTCSPGMR